MCVLDSWWAAESGVGLVHRKARARPENSKNLQQTTWVRQHNNYNIYIRIYYTNSGQKKVVFIVVIAVIVCFCVMFSIFLCNRTPLKTRLSKIINLLNLLKRNPHLLFCLHICLHLGEETSRALKTLRSSKAPLVKKRQVMRAISGDYRKKIEEERARQFKLIQSGKAVAEMYISYV